MQIQDIETNAAGLVRVRFTPGQQGPTGRLIEHARAVAAHASRGPVEFLYAVHGGQPVCHDFIFAGIRPR